MLDAVPIPLEANGQTSWLIEDAFTTTDTTDFTGCGAVRRDRGGAVYRRGPGNGSRHPYLYDTAGGAGPGDAISGIDEVAPTQNGAARG